MKRLSDFEIIKCTYMNMHPDMREVRPYIEDETETNVYRYRRLEIYQWHTRLPKGTLVPTGPLMVGCRDDESKHGEEETK